MKKTMTRTLLNDIARKKNDVINDTIIKQTAYRPHCDITDVQFADLMLKNIKIKMVKTNDFGDFIFDEYNKPVFRQLYYHLTMDDRFIGDLEKGIWLYGKTGRGKSTILEAYSMTITDLTRRYFINLHAKELTENIIKFGYEYFDRRPLHVDDAGREAKELNIFGNKTIPMMEIIQRRERCGAFTLMSSNWRFDEIRFSIWSEGKQKKVGYGAATNRRAKKIFNEIELTGNDRTK